MRIQNLCARRGSIPLVWAELSTIERRRGKQLTRSFDGGLGRLDDLFRWGRSNQWAYDGVMGI